MFDTFLEFFGEAPVQGDSPESAESFVRLFGGKSFGEGILFGISEQDLPQWHKNIDLVYGADARGLSPFAYDWQGNCLADREDDVHILEPGTADLFSTEMSVGEFLCEELVEDPENAIGATGWNRWLASGGVRPAYNQCIRYKVPLFLKGKNKVSNLELSDVFAYWRSTSQMAAQRRTGQ